MNKTQWFILSVFCILMGIYFISIDTPLNSCGTTGQLTVYDVWCVLNSEMFDPFIWLLFPLGMVFFIMGLLEKEK